LNRRPPACKAGALPIELQPQGTNENVCVAGAGGIEPPSAGLESATLPLCYAPMVVRGRFELPTPWSSTKCSTKLSYRTKGGIGICPRIFYYSIVIDRRPRPLLGAIAFAACEALSSSWLKGGLSSRMLKRWFGGRDLNPDRQLQKLLSCH
jgi:hypothetical protein